MSDDTRLGQIAQRVTAIERDLNDNRALVSDRDEANLRYLIATVRLLLPALPEGKS